MNNSDYTLTNHGSIILVKPESDDARTFLEDHVGDDAQWFGGALAVEPRYVDDLVANLQNDGWSVA